MRASFPVNTSHLTHDFVDKLKALFGEQKEILITVEEDEDAAWCLFF